MYEQYWRLTEKPFENVPDPKFIFLSKQHEEALFRLRYAIEGKKGAALLTGVFGCGKTLVSRVLMSRLGVGKYKTVCIKNPQMKAVELLRTIARQLGAENLVARITDMSSEYFRELIEQMLFDNTSNGTETIVFIDEAHVINDPELFDEIRMLLNLQDEKSFLLTLILMGQPELIDKVQRNKPLLQRIAIGFDIKPLGDTETSNYIKYRLKVAGRTEEIYDKSALSAIYHNSNGIPRRINQVCDISLLIGFKEEAKMINEDKIKEAISGLGVYKHV
ncbi:ExeA family protein [Candidatus Margulisiibacteriota bacterium]